MENFMMTCLCMYLRSKRIFVVHCLVLLAALFLIQGCDEEIIDPVPKQVVAEFPVNGPGVRLIFGGDLMMARGVGTFVETEKNGDYTWLLARVAGLFRQADLSFVNLESVISGMGQELQTKIGPKFRADPDAVDALVDAGIDMVSIANNHAFDYTKTAYEDSINTLRENGVMDIGGGFNACEAYDPVVCTFRPESGGEPVAVAFIAFNRVGLQVWGALDENTGVAWLSDENLEAGITKARSMADLVIVSMHFGTENELVPTNEDQLHYARLAVDLGADLVVGHHPHVIQPVELYRGKYIAFSLGNLVFDQMNDEHRTGILLDVIIEEKMIKNIELLKYRINEYFQPVNDTSLSIAETF